MLVHAALKRIAQHKTARACPTCPNVCDPFTLFEPSPPTPPTTTTTTHPHTQSGVSPCDLVSPVDQLQLLSLLAVSQTRPHTLWWQAFLSTCQVQGTARGGGGVASRGTWVRSWGEEVTGGQEGGRGEEGGDRGTGGKPLGEGCQGMQHGGVCCPFYWGKWCVCMCSCLFTYRCQVQALEMCAYVERG